MKKTYFGVLLVMVFCLAAGCENRRETRDAYNQAAERADIGEDLDFDHDEGFGMEITSDSVLISTGKPPVPAYTSDTDFVAMAASGGIMKVEAGRTAERKAANAEVKKVARQMAADHSHVNNELKALAAKKAWKMPATMNAVHQVAYDRLVKMSGSGFDRDYMAQMIIEHESAIGMFEQATRYSTDADLQAFASKTLPGLRKHLDLARELNNTVK